MSIVDGGTNVSDSNKGRGVWALRSRGSWVVGSKDPNVRKPRVVALYQLHTIKMRGKILLVLPKFKMNLLYIINKADASRSSGIT
jgi:hypothetical protein